MANVEVLNDGLDPKRAVAIIGIGCRFPGAEDAQAYWNLLVNGTDAVGEYCGRRSRELDTFYEITGGDTGPMTNRGGFLRGLDLFDADLFEISPREAEYMDPQQRLLHEVAWEALEDGGQVREKYAGSNTAVFVGIWLNDYETMVQCGSPVAEFLATTGGGVYAGSGRLAYSFDFRGGAVTVNTACSSSMVAIHQACQALRAGECRMALAGGANTILGTEITQAYTRARLLSRDGRCKFGDASADGYVRSEGAALIVLKLLAEAERDGDSIYAVIRGSAVNNDGKSGGLLVTPSQAGQEEMLRAAYQDAGIAACDVQYVEAHGTGTVAGDAVELGAVANVIGNATGRATHCAIGSCKTNIGHTESAAGVAGVIKVALALKHKFIPPTLHVTQPTPAITWDHVGVKLQTTGSPWPQTGAPARAGVSGFGITGTNAHIVMEAAPEKLCQPTVVREAYLLPITAKTPSGLNALAQSYISHLDGKDRHALHDICCTAALKRTHLEQRAAIIAGEAPGIIDGLQCFLRREEQSGVIAGTVDAERPPKVAFVFPGQGSQWAGMGRELFRTDEVFRSAIVDCDELIREEAGWSLIGEIDDSAAPARLDQIDVVQPVLFAIEVALAQLWRSWGVEPATVIGQSMGEVAAAHIGGALTLRDAVRIICRRSKLLRQVRGRGVMAVVELSSAEAEAAIQGFEDCLSVAVSSSPRSTVLSGDPTAMDIVIGQLEKREVFCRLVRVDVASHSPQMDPLLADLLHQLEDIHPLPGSIPMHSTVLGQTTDGSGFDAAYWAQNLRQPVLFSAAVQTLLAEGCNVFLEISPQPILATSVQQGIVHAGRPAIVVASLRRNEPETATMLAGLAHLFVKGQRVSWSKVYTSGANAALPGYPWQRERFWFESHGGVARKAKGIRAHALLGPRVESATGESVWTARFGVDSISWLKDHSVGGIVLLPASAYVEMAMAVATEVYRKRNCRLEQLSIITAIAFQKDVSTEIQVVSVPEGSGYTLRFYCRSEGSAEWTLAARGVLADYSAAAISEVMASAMFAPPGDRERSAHEHQRTMDRLGYEFGPSFRCVHWQTSGEREATAEIRLPEEIDSSGYVVHPAMLDAAFQILSGLVVRRARAVARLLPVRIEAVELIGTPEVRESIFVRAVLTDGGALSGDIFLYDSKGRLLVRVSGLAFRQIESRKGSGLYDFLYTVKWEPSERAAEAPSVPGTWVFFSDQGGIGDQLGAALHSRGDATMFIYREELTKAQNDDACAAKLGEMLKSRARSSALKGVVHLWSMDISEGERLAEAERNCAELSRIVQVLIEQNLESKLWLVTCNACPVGPPGRISVLQAPVWGLVAVISNEHPSLRCTCVDLPRFVSPDDCDALLAEVSSWAVEERIALRGGKRFVAHLTPFIQSRPHSPQLRKPRPDERFALRLQRAGVLDDCELHASQRVEPGDGQVEIEVVAAGVNFKDVMKAMGLEASVDPHLSLGAECAGRILRVGRNVCDLKEGEEVLALTPSFRETGLFVSHAIVPEKLAFRKPKSLSLVDAAGISWAYLTAYLGLVKMAKLQKNERVLIHSASGGVGLAALRIARWLGAEVFATAGSAEKREHLKKNGATHVMDSRTLEFSGKILRITGGRGVDVVLNSLAGPAIQEGLRALAPYGRFVEIGKRDIRENARIGLAPFDKSISFLSLDLGTAVEDRQELIVATMRELLELFDSGVLQALPVEVFPITKAANGFRHMAQGRHIGKVVLDLQSPDVAVRNSVSIRSDSTYLITGGLGALGLASGRELVELGARHLLLAGRNAPSAEARATIARLEREGVRVRVAQTDIADEGEVRSMISSIAGDMPPLRGIVHAAGVLNDALVSELDRNHFHTAMAGKAGGAMVLDRVTSGMDLDFFILFSSVTSLLGLPGQGNYAAANALLDALAHDRAARGLAATSINWGPWSQIGLAAATTQRGERIAAQGLRSLSPADGLSILRQLLEEATPQIVAMDFDAQRWCESVPANARPCLFAKLGVGQRKAVAEPQEAQILEKLQAANASESRSLLRAHLLEQMAVVLKTRADKIPTNKPMRSLGLDSLMSLELRNRLERTLHLKLPASAIWNYPTVAALADHLAGKLCEPVLEAELPRGKQPIPTASASIAEMLKAELESAEDLLRKR